MTRRWLYAWGLGSVAFGGASLLVPLYVVQLGGTPVDLGLLAATAAGVGAPGAILFGRLADRVERRRSLVLATLSAVAVALGVVPVLSSVTAVVVANAVLWLAVGSVAPVVTMLVVDDAPEAAWSERIGLLNRYQGYGWAGGLVLGAVWPGAGARLVGPETVTRVLFWLLAACALASAVWAARTLPRPAPEDHVTSARKKRRIARLMAASRRGVRGATFAFSPNRLYWSTGAIRPRRLIGRTGPALAIYFLAAMLFFTGFAAFWAPLPLFLTGIGVDSGGVFALYLASSLASAVAYGGAGRLAARLDARVLQSGALAARGLLFPAVALLAALADPGSALRVGVAAFAGIGLTWAVIAVVGTAIVTRLAAASVRGEALGAYTALGAIGGGIGGVLGGWVATAGYLVAFGVAGGLVLAGAGLVAAVRLTGRDAGAAVPAAADADPAADERL